MPAIVTLTMNPALDIATETDIIVPSTKLRCDEPRYEPGGQSASMWRARRLCWASILGRCFLPAARPLRADE